MSDCRFGVSLVNYPDPDPDVNFARDPLRSYSGVTLNLHGARCVHTSMNCRKWNSSLIFTLCFYIVFVHYLWNFDLNLANKQRRKVITVVFGYFVQQPSLWHDVNRTLRRPVNYCIYLWRRLRVTSRERVSFMGVWTPSVQNRFI